jgi:hypothetical protein
LSCAAVSRVLIRYRIREDSLGRSAVKPHLPFLVAILENHDYIVDITTGNVPKYRMTEAFAALLRQPT